MKKLNKLLINAEKLLKNEELTALRGGYDGANCCLCYGGFPIEPQTYMGGTTHETCDATCKEASYFYGLWLCLI
jgi:natural product precursor